MIRCETYSVIPFTKDVLKHMPDESRSDENLIALIHEGDVQALEELYDRHRVLAYSLALRVLANPGDAEDVVQEAFVKVWRSAGTYQRERSGGRSWLLSIVHHSSIDKIRGRQSRIQPIALDDGMNVADGSDVWREVSQRLTGQDVQQALDQLPLEQRQTIELAYFKGYTQTQIATSMSVPLGTVKGRMRIGLFKLKTLLESSHTGMAIE